MLSLNKRSDNKIERVVEDFLKKLGVSYEKQKYLKISDKTWCFPDFTVDDKVIEVQGDFWHANPEMYSIEELTEVQRVNVERDMYKREFYINNGYTVLYLWENIIRTNPKKVLEELKKFLEGK